ncbi:hypothetical protein D3C76_1029430 [compost metagenome]
MDQGHVTGQARWRNDFLLHVEQEVGALLRRNVRHRLREGEVLPELDDGVGAVGLRRGLGDYLREVGTAITGLVVPHHFHASLRNREGVVVRLLEVLQAIAVVDRLGIQRTDLRRVVHRLRSGGAATGRVDRNLVGVRVALEHRLLAGGQLVLVLVDVGLGDGEQRLVILERVAEEAIGIHRSGARLEATGPLRNAAIGIRGLFATQRCQGGSQFGRFLGGNGCHYAAGEERERQNSRMHHCFCFHASTLGSSEIT